MQFEVTMICKVRKLVTVNCDSEEEARDRPFENAIDEVEVDQMDWEITNVVCTERE